MVLTTRGFRPQRPHTLCTTPASRHTHSFCTMTPTTTATAHLIDGEAPNFEVHFLHSDHPRDGFHVMSVNPLVHYEFRTPIGFLSTHTIVRFGTLHPAFSSKYPPSDPTPRSLTTVRLMADDKNNRQVTDASGATVVAFNWFGPSALGTMTVRGSPEQETHMGELVQPSPSMSE